jgi:hypothetical protein
MKKNKTIYILGKITGDPNYKEKFAKAEKILTKKGFTVMNPAILPGGFEYEEYMKICFSMLDVCEYAHPLPDWKNSPGATRERNRAIKKKKMFIY